MSGHYTVTPKIRLTELTVAREAVLIRQGQRLTRRDAAATGRRGITGGGLIPSIWEQIVPKKEQRWLKEQEKKHAP